MYSNKSENNIAIHTKGLSGVRDISQHFDTATGVVVRSKKHTTKDTAGDEIVLIEDLRKLRPFKFQSGRQHKAFPNIKKSMIDYLKVSDYHSWIKYRIISNACDLGD